MDINQIIPMKQRPNKSFDKKITKFIQGLQIYQEIIFAETSYALYLHSVDISSQSTTGSFNEVW